MKKILITVIIIMVLLGCRKANNKIVRNNEKSKVKMINTSSEYKKEIEQNVLLGQLIYTMDKTAANGFDFYFKLIKDKKLEPSKNIAGWLSYRNESSFEPEMIIVGLDKTKKPYVIFRYIVSKNGERYEKPDKTEYLMDNTFRMFLATQTAMRSGFERMTRNYNPVVIPGEFTGKDGWIVYLLAATSNSNEILLGGHYKLTISDNGTEIKETQRFSNGVVLIDRTKQPKGSEFHAVMYKNNRFDYPTECNVFESILYRTPIILSTKNKLWEIKGKDIIEMNINAK